ncbi:MAG: response regulator transcription factor [Burkholderiales bacterium]|nr:response regulator transcription factor [Pseudomonadota bacterium]MCZ2135115.1 response regulator transcription factor [Burkholderiales bacterium]
MRILLVEDDPVLRDVMGQSLIDAGHRVDRAVRLAEAEQIWRYQPFDAILLDLNLPDGNALDLLKRARGWGDTTPVLVLTARNRTDERIEGLDAGADDYLGKPFDLAEVEARLRALVRRSHGGGNVVEVGRLRFDGVSMRIHVGERPFDLPAREFEVLWELAHPPGRVVSKRALSDKLSGLEDALGDNALEAFVSRLRRKLAGSGATIRTLRGLGYLLERDGSAP